MRSTLIRLRFILLLFTPIALPIDHVAEELFLAPLQRQSATVEAAPAGVKRARKVLLNVPLLQSGSSLRRQSAATAGDAAGVTLNLFEDRTHDVTITKTAAKGEGKFVSFGKVEGEPASLVILSVNDGVMAGSVFIPGEDTVRISYAGDGTHLVAEIDSTQIPGCSAEAVPVGEALPGAELPRPAGDAPVRVDIMVLYTGAAKTGAGGTTAMEALIDLAVAEANETYVNSEIDVELNLVYRGELSYTESGSANTDLVRLRTSGDGQLETAHSLRSQYGADVVVLLTENMASYAGLAYVMAPVSTGFAPYAFGVVKREYATGSYVFAHEVGHIMGCQHDRAAASSGGAYDYSYGHHLDVSGTTYRTVMAYAPGTRIPHFSNPDVDFLSTATGVAAGETNSANNALSINNTAATVAAFAGEAAIIQFEITSTNITEGASTYSFNVIRSGPTNSAASINYTTTGVSATAGADYTAASGTLSFAAGETSKTVDLAILSDTAVESSEIVRLVLSTPVGAVLGTDKILEVTILDDDIGIMFSASTASIAEDGTNVIVNVLRTGDSSGTNEVDYATSDITAESGSDYTAASGTLTFGAGETNKIISVTVSNDSSFESNETFRVSLSNATSGATLVTPTNLVVTILEDDAALALTTNAVSALENSASVSLTVTRTGGTNNVATVDYFTEEGTGTNSVDFVSTNGTLSFGAGVASRTITVPLLNDTDVDGAKTFSLTLTNVTGATLGGTTNVTVTVADNDSSFEFSTNAVSVAESTANASLTIVRSGGVIGSATVRYSTTNDSATASSDYTAKSAVLTFAAGETSKTVTIAVLNDTSYETNESFKVFLSNPTGESTLGAVDEAVVTIADNDSALSWDTNAVTVAEGDGTVTVTVNRTGTLTQTNTVRYTFRAGTATTADYSGTNGTLTFAPDATNATISVTITDDSVIEGSEMFSLQLSNPTGGATISGTNTASVTIEENDVALAFSAATYAVDEGATNVTLTIVQTGDTNAIASVDYATSDLGAAAGDDYTATNGTLNFGAGTNSLTITIPVSEDSLLETNESFRVALSNVSGAVLLANSNAVVRILENDTALGFTTNAVAAVENAAGATLTVVRSGGTNYAVTIDYFTTAGTGTNGVDFTGTNGTVTLAAGVNSRTVTIPLLNDSAVDGAKTFDVTLTNAVGAILADTTNATVTISDNDSTFEFSTNAVTVAETAGSVTLTVTRTGGAIAAATVRYATTNETATAGTDYTAKSGVLSFKAGETNKTVVIPVTNDTSSETNEVFNVVLSSPTGEGAVGTYSSVAVTLTDNDSSLSWASSAVTVAEDDGTVSLTVNRTGTLTETNTIRYAFRAGTATSADYSGTNGTLTILPGETNGTISVSITDDALVESSEVFTVQLSSPGGGALLGGTNTATVTIEENDVGLAFSAAIYSGDEGSTNVTLTVVQTGDTNAVASVDYATADLGATAGDDYTATNGTLNFGPGTNTLTITIPLTEDSESETNETFSVALSNVSGAALLVNSNATVRILENDSVIAFSTNSVTAGENAESSTITVLRMGGTNYTATVDYFTDGGTGTNSVDYVSTNGTLTFGVGVSSRTITVPLVNDSAVDGEKTFGVYLTNVVGGILGMETNKTVTINDNDSTFSFSTNAVLAAETSGSVTLTVVRSGGLIGAASVRYATTNDSATAGSDYTAKSGLLSFKAGETSKTVTITIANDTANETNETFSVVLHTPTGESALGDNSSVAVTITDNDSLLAWDESTVSAAEDDGTVVLTVNRTGTLTGTNTVRYTIRAGTATAADYSGTNGVLTFGAGDTNATITIALTDDTVVENSESFSVILSSPTGGALLSGTNTAVVTIEEDDIGLAFSAATYSAAESSTNVTLTVVQTGDTNAVASVDYATADGEAVDGDDYTASTGTLNFGPGTNSLTITIPIAEDTEVESNETFQVQLSNASGALLLASSNAVVRILENDSVLALSTNAISVNENVATVTLTVLRTGGTNDTSAVDYLTEAGTGTNAVDFTATSGTLTFGPGVASRTIIVPLLNDSAVDGEKTFSVVLTNEVGAALGTVTNTTVTIADNDSTFEFTTNAVTVAESTSSVTLTVIRAGGLVGAATIRYTTTNDTAAAGSDYTAKSGVLNFAANETNKTFTIAISNDTTVETNESFNVALTTPTGEGSIGATDSMAVTITDNDSRLEWNTNSVSVAEGDGTVTLTIDRTGTLTETNTVAYTIRAGTARTTDYSGSNGTLTFVPSQTNATISINITDDAVVETTETFSVVLSRPTGGALIGGTNTTYVNITENDVGLAFNAATYNVAETGTNVTLTLMQTGDTNASVTVDWATSDLTATNAVDYTETNGSLAFGAGTNSLTITIPILDDTELENNETFHVTLSNPSGAILLANSNAVVRILEDDSALAFSTNAVSVLENAASVTLTVLRTGGTNFAASVEFVSADDSATDGADYSSVTNTTLSFDPGVARKTIVIPLSNDNTVEGDETFSLTLTNISGADFGAHTNAVVTILDNDSVFNLSTNEVEVSESAGTTSFTVVRTGGVAAAAAVRYSTTNGTATAGVDYRAKNVLLKFKAGETNKTFTVSIINDLVVDADEAFSVGLSSPTGEATIGTNDVTTITIVDNDFNIGGSVIETGLKNIAITNMRWDNENCVTLEIEGPLGSSVVIESSADLTSWSPVAQGVLGGVPLLCRDGESAGKPLNFYRIVQPAESESAADEEP